MNGRPSSGWRSGPGAAGAGDWAALGASAATSDAVSASATTRPAVGPCPLRHASTHAPASSGPGARPGGRPGEAGPHTHGPADSIAGLPPPPARGWPAEHPPVDGLRTLAARCPRRHRPRCACDTANRARVIELTRNRYVSGGRNPADELLPFVTTRDKTCPLSWPGRRRGTAVVGAALAKTASGTAPSGGSFRLVCTRARGPSSGSRLWSAVQQVIEGEFRMARRLQAFLACWAIAMAFPAVAAAQSAFTGTVKDTSGAVLPGVTVEASSPVLIEGTRSTVTDSDGQYRITDLRPGVYTVTFTLPGFKQQRQEKVELRVDFVGTLNGTLEVGAIEEAITVTGTSPTVDVSSNSKVEVMTRRDPRAGADRPDHPGAGAAGQRRLAQRPRRRRVAGDAADLHVDARSDLRQQHRHGRRPDGQRPRRRRRGAAVLQPGDDGRDELPDERRRRRRLAGRRPHEHRPQGRRQPLQRQLLLVLERQGVAERQPQPGHHRPRPARRPAASTASTTSTWPSAGRSSATSCGSSPRAGCGRWTPRSPTPSTRRRAARIQQSASAGCRTGAARLRTGHRRPEHRERAAAPHLADHAQAQVLGLLRRDQQVARPRHEPRRRPARRRRRSGPRRATTRRPRSTPAPSATRCWPRPATRSTTRSTSSPTRTA